MHTAPSLRENDYSQLRAFCLFIGYPQSGHSLVGALLDAHPDAALAHGADVVSIALMETPRRDDLFAALLDNSRDAATSGRMQTGYSYAVAGSWQGRVRTLRVIGDKAGSKTTRRLMDAPHGLETVESLVELPLRLIHVVRNPFDNVASIRLIKDGKTLPRAVKTYGRLAGVNARLLSESGRGSITVRHEDLVAAPKVELRRLCDFLGLEPDDAYLENAARLVFSSPRRTRERVDWGPDEVAAVEALVETHSFLAGYGLDG
jgi:hypothetical protein